MITTPKVGMIGIQDLTVHATTDGDYLVEGGVISPETAYLLSAAPDLLEALEGCLQFIETTEEWDWGDPETQAFHARARAAIAKAKGET